jgi:hypothetical protein
MSSTITRTTWTDDTGTPASPAGDGTIINNAQLQLIYDRIDSLFTGELIAGRLSAESHSSGIAIKADVANSGGGVIGRIRNTQAGTAANAEVRVGNDGSEQACRIIMCSTTFTTAGFVVQDGATIICARVGGLNLAASHASGLVRQMGKSGYSVVRANITSNQTDYAPSDGGILILTPDASRRIDGITGGVDGRRIRIVNGAAIGSGFVLTIGYASGAAGNQVTMAAAADRGLNPQAVMDLVYDGTNTVWVGGPSS